MEEIPIKVSNPVSTETIAPSTKPPVKQSTLVWRWLKRFFVFIISFLVVYFTIILIGLIPTNINFTETPQGIDIFISSTAIHADVILPIKNEIFDWSKLFPQSHFQGDISSVSHVMIGWGNKGFYLETPTWSELKLSTALKAMFTLSPCCLHVVLTGIPQVNANTRKVTISKQQYEEMVNVIKKQFQQDASNQLLIIVDKNFHNFDSFYEAHGAYYCLNTCNSWIGHVMRKSGIRTPLLTPLPKTMFLYLEKPHSLNP